MHTHTHTSEISSTISSFFGSSKTEEGAESKEDVGVAKSTKDDVMDSDNATANEEEAPSHHGGGDDENGVCVCVCLCV